MTAKTKPTEEFRMSAGEFDRIMGKALRVKATEAKKPKAKAKATKKPG